MESAAFSVCIYIYIKFVALSIISDFPIHFGNQQTATMIPPAILLPGLYFLLDLKMKSRRVSHLSFLLLLKLQCNLIILYIHSAYIVIPCLNYSIREDNQSLYSICKFPSKIPHSNIPFCVSSHFFRILNFFSYANDLSLAH